MGAATSVGHWLKQRRKSLDLTQADLARQIGCAVSTLQKIEADERRPSRQMAGLLACALGIAPEKRLAFIDFARSDRLACAFHVPTNLPAPPTPLIGREREVEDISQRLLRDDTRLITLVGPPGIGKTRLGVQVASVLRDQFEDGVFFVAMASITDPELVVPTIARTLGLKEVARQPTFDQLVSYLDDRLLLLVLDNFEQVIDAASKVAELLSACSRLKLLATSRVALRVRAERQQPVPPLGLPDLNRLPPIDQLRQTPAVALFVDRAEAVNPDFALTAANAPVVAAICHRLDGLPLAIELIAACIKVLTPQALLDRLREYVMLQFDELRDIDERQRTLQNAIEWSYNLLALDEQVLFTRLAVFAGGWSLEAMDAICVVNSVSTILAPDASRRRPQSSSAVRLVSLVNKSLVIRHAQGDEIRFTMLEMIREFAWERLCASGECDTLQRRHHTWYRQLAVTAEPQLTAADQMQWLSRLECEHGNLRQVLNDLIEERSGYQAAQLCIALRHFWVIHAHLDEGRRYIERVLAGWTEPAAGAELIVRMKLLNAAGCLTFYQGDYVAANAYYQSALALAQASGEQHAAAFALDGLGAVAAGLGDRPAALVWAQQSLQLSRAISDRWLSAITLITLGELARLDEDYGRATQLYQESLTLLRALGDRWFIAIVLNNLGQVAQYQGRYGEAQPIHAECLTLCCELENYRGVAICLEKFAGVTVLRGQYERAARLLGAAQAVRAATHAAVETGTLDRVDYDRCQALVRDHLGGDRCAACRAEGCAMTLEQAIAYALEQTAASLPKMSALSHTR